MMQKFVVHEGIYSDGTFSVSMRTGEKYFCVASGLGESQAREVAHTLNAEWEKCSDGWISVKGELPTDEQS